MARTKQTARKSTGGAAPRQMHTATGSASLRGFFTSQQQSGSSDGRQAVFVNNENTFSEFQFRRPIVANIFEPKVSIARVRRPHLSSSDDLFMRIDFCSKFDGVLQPSDRMPIDVSFVLDISGSMGSTFPDDPDRRTKLDVAKDCLLNVCKQLGPKDRMSVITFNHDTETILPTGYCTPSHISKLSKVLASVRCTGGTDLSLGIQAGFNELRSVGQASLLSRAIFLTDMESGQDDEARVIKVAKDQALGIHNPAPALRLPSLSSPSRPSTPSGRDGKRKSTGSDSAAADKKRPKVAPLSPCYLSVVGIGVDLSVRTVQAVSSIPGAKYCSVLSCNEFISSVAQEFTYDVMPIAFNINLSLSQGVSFQKIFGSPELNDISFPTSQATISSEFPCPMTDGNVNGGIYLMHLKTSPNVKEGSLEFTWKSLDGSSIRQTLNFAIPPPLLAGSICASSCDTGIRKAVALTEYVRLLSKYSTDERFAAEIPRWPFSPSRTINIPSDVCGRLRVAGADSVLLMSAEEHGVRDAQFKLHHEYARLFTDAFSYLRAEMLACGDSSLTSSNKNIVETVSRIVEVEKSEFMSILAAADRQRPVLLSAQLAPVAPALSSPVQDSGSGSSSSDDDDDDRNPSADTPASFICPISHMIFKDPVIAADDNTYERSHIAQWLLTSGKSPLTNLPLRHKRLRQNRSLRSAIDEYLASRASVALVPAAAADTTAQSGSSGWSGCALM